MRKIMAAVLAMLLAVCVLPGAQADKARGIQTREDEAFHVGHLAQHIDDTTCCVTGNYIKVRAHADLNASVIGHVEQADELMLLELQGGLARIRVLRSDETSPDSWIGLEGWINALYLDCNCSDAVYHAGADMLTGGFFPVGMPAKWYFCSGAGAWSTDLTISEDGSFTGYYSDWDGGETSMYSRGELQECRFRGQFSLPERISSYEYRIVVLQIEQDGTPGETFVRDEMLVTTTHPYGIGQGDTMILYLPGTPMNRIPPAYHEWAYVENDEWSTLDYALYNMTDAFGWNEN